MAEQLRTFTATIAKVSDRGFKTAGDDKWWNWSKFGADRVEPPIGARVEVTVDGRDFVKAIEVVRPATPAAAVATVVPPAPPIATPEPTPAPVATPAIQQDDRGTVVSRLAVLNTATAILSSGGRAVVVEDVLAIAARLEAWATR